MEYAIVSVPAAPVRCRPNHRKEMVSQLLFGEAVNVLKENDALWVKIRGLHDGYEGWMTNSQLEAVDEKTARIRSVIAVSGLLNEVQTGDRVIQVPFGASLPFFENGKGRIGEREFIFPGACRNIDTAQATAEQLVSYAHTWLNAPYLWGGRTPLGVDCSGYVQVIFKMLGIDLPRDTWQQAQEGNPVKKLRDAKAGDLVFFDNKEEIVHVGILTDNEHVIHASGKVRIDGISKKGIIDADTGKRTIRLRAIRRILKD